MKTRIYCYGDSITANGGWQKIIEQDLDVAMINGGRGGRRATEFHEFVESFNNSLPVDQLIILIGVNDLPRRDDREDDQRIDDCVAGVWSVLAHAIQQGIKSEDILIVAPANVNPESMDELNQGKGYHLILPLLKKLESAYRDLARVKACSFTSLFGEISADSFMDGLHMNEQGNAQIAAVILKAIKSDR